MKKTIALLAVSLSAFQVQAQLAVGKSAVTNNSVSLEFSNTENRGLVLPYNINKSGITENGTMIYDTTDHKVKYLKDNAWFDFSVDTSGTSDLSIQGADKTEQPGAKVAIYSTGSTNTTSGILVLEDTNKAMILPKVASPHLNIINPAPGMMAYDTTKRQLAVYNGTVWSFWKP
ncbi:hypothetical protein EG359_19275 [Chryseobacterium joostei]|uniref:Uncharacterized protein n=1 Tax=Chryseobacterium joostei TaxID=112234 RepID=A0A1N7J2M0_9FLAO|nr:hypothetical protein [Chryseobacterium joostei]AZB01611.1 hypothetical protein EG359_19260 [Chryseobacterium joostei]AZB01614.1 hypothetical protein EG359_19275 [Chryseobacterium joostei]SIS43612.1 hypothetical protein SAMN05421768_107223 [Chryseobacterium joostei]SIS43639.1 hypothetical protein SAMN05421768_107226 [Chryseobacterium joostei]